MDRRDFLKNAGALAATPLLSSCARGSKNSDVKDLDGRAGEMTYRVNPSSGDRVSLLGYGMMRLPREGGASQNSDAPIDQEMVNRQVDYALEHGVNYFDTSPVYCQGLSEKVTGIALSCHPRDSYYIATKLSNFDPSTRTREASVAMFEESLRELRTDYIDYLLLHAIGGGDDSLAEFNSRFMDNGVLDYLVEQKRAGRIRNLGFSYHGDQAIFDMLLDWHDKGLYHWDFVQIELNYLDWDYAREINARNTDASYLYAELHRRGIPAVIMEPLLGGRLSRVPDFVADKMQKRDPLASIASWAFRFAGTPEGVLCVLSGMTYMEHLVENVRTYSPLRPVTESENAFLMDIAKDIYNLNTIPCNECNYCMPCPYGLDIPAIFHHYNKCVNEGYIRHDTQDPEYRKARRAFLVGYDRSVPRLRQANMCIGCGKCMSHCPQSIRIPREMRRIDAYVERLKRSEGGIL